MTSTGPDGSLITIREAKLLPNLKGMGWEMIPGILPDEAFCFSKKPVLSDTDHVGSREELIPNTVILPPTPPPCLPPPEGES